MRRPSSQSCRDSNVSNLTPVWCWCVCSCACGVCMFVCVCAFRKEGWFFSYSHQTMKTCVLSLPRRPMWWERTLNRRTRQLQKLPLVDRLWKKPSSSFVTCTLKWRPTSLPSTRQRPYTRQGIVTHTHAHTCAHAHTHTHTSFHFASFSCPTDCPGSHGVRQSPHTIHNGGRYCTVGTCASQQVAWVLSVCVSATW